MKVTRETDLLAYADRQSVTPGAEIQFKVSCGNSEIFRTDIVRLFSPEVGPGPDAPEFREELLETDVNGDYGAQWQPINPGSYVHIPAAPDFEALTGFTFVCAIQATNLDSGRQTIFSSADPERGIAVTVDSRGNLGLVIRGGSQRRYIDSGLGIESHRWTMLAVSVDGVSKQVQFSLDPVRSHRLERQRSSRSTRAFESQSGLGRGPLVIGAELLEHLSGKPVPENCFNGRIERPRLLGGALNEEELGELTTSGVRSKVDGVIADWDFSVGIDGEKVDDVTGNGFDGWTVNLPTRGVGGSTWNGATRDWRVDPQQYGAIHFHADDLFDAGWDTSLTLAIPDSWSSGCYAARFRAGSAEFYVPFFVTPGEEHARAKVAFLIPTATYAAYANLRLRVTGQWNELIHGRLTVLDETDLLMLKYPELGLSTYDAHSDGSTVVHSSMRRPVTNFRPKGRIYKFCQDLLIVAWLEQEGMDFDVITDEDLDRQGSKLINSYDVLITSSHPEYVSTRMLDSVESYLRDGGRLMYLGGNGFHHRVAFHPSIKGVVEVRRPDAPRLWMADPSQGNHTFTGEPAGTWTGLGRPAQLLTGVAFVTQGFDECSYYRRTRASFDPRASFIFDGVEEEIVGDFGILQGGAAGYEIDRADTGLGTPSHALVVASSESHSNLFDLMVVSLEDELPVTDADSPDRIRADMVFFETPAGGAVFSVGSIAWSGSLSQNRYENNIARITSNVLRRFLDPQPFEVPNHAG